MSHPESSLSMTEDQRLINNLINERTRLEKILTQILDLPEMHCSSSDDPRSLKRIMMEGYNIGLNNIKRYIEESHPYNNSNDNVRDKSLSQSRS